ncbi:MAG: hypothetical protein ABIH82_00005, partial [Candidatus Woesearchaeota archaeon]
MAKKDTLTKSTLTKSNPIKSVKVTPWEVKGKVDYNKLIKEFGLQPLQHLPEIFQKNVLFRRGLIFAHR